MGGLTSHPWNINQCCREDGIYVQISILPCAILIKKEKFRFGRIRLKRFYDIFLILKILTVLSFGGKNKKTLIRTKFCVNVVVFSPQTSVSLTYYIEKDSLVSFKRRIYIEISTAEIRFYVFTKAIIPLLNLLPFFVIRFQP